MALAITVEAEEDIYSFAPADNGASPLWCHGSTTLARRGDQVYMAGLETVPERPPLNNCRWLLYGRDANGWSLLHRDQDGYTREPSPLALLDNGDLIVSANPSLAGEAYNGPAEPTVFRFSGGQTPPTAEHPQWRGQPAFTEHSYRSLVADGPANPRSMPRIRLYRSKLIQTQFSTKV